MAKVEDKDDQTDKAIAYIADLADFQPDPDNLNLHTQRGQALVTQSQQKRGYGRPAFAANDGTVLGGNYRQWKWLRILGWAIKFLKSFDWDFVEQRALVFRL